jgi:hypothetical protein
MIRHSVHAVDRLYRNMHKILTCPEMFLFFCPLCRSYTELQHLSWTVCTGNAQSSTSFCTTCTPPDCQWIHQLPSFITLFPSSFRFPFYSFYPTFFILKKNKSRLMRSPCRLCVSVSIPINLWMPEPIFTKPRTYIMAPKPISTAYFMNPSHQSVCIPLSLLGKGSVKMFPRQRRIIRRVVSYAVRIVWKETRRLFLF